MKAVLQYRVSDSTRRRLEQRAARQVELEVVDPAEKDRFAQAMRDADVLLHVLDPVTGAMLANAPALRLIQKIGVGLNTIDLEAARTRGIAVANMPGTNSQAVAEHALALMLAAMRRVAYLDRETRAGGGWTTPPDTFDAVGEIAGSTIGLVGFGEVPQRLAPVLKALGARVLYATRTPRPTADAEPCPLDELWERCDVVSLHVPLTAETSRLVNREAIARMKPGAILVNTARGGLVDEAALAEALRSGRLAAAGLDVLQDEPAADPGHTLFALENVVVTPHVAWLTPRTLERSFDVALANCERLASGRPLLHQVA
ncbi:MAG: 2-hydroxyacid dehydrogenase [Burkholderiaceae bacterium]|nr:2-hydroxyacid dehydrogenase [Burkholderiaceae bacterium]